MALDLRSAMIRVDRRRSASIGVNRRQSASIRVNPRQSVQSSMPKFPNIELQFFFTCTTHKSSSYVIKRIGKNGWRKLVS